jgi:hypothetical protein
MTYPNDFTRLLNPSKTPKNKSTKEAWIAIFLVCLVTAFLIAIGGIGGKILAIVFPVSMLAVGWFLYFRYPPFYVGFVWWTMFLTPLVRRLADFRVGIFTDSNPILLAPSLVILVSFHTMYFNLPRAREQGSAPFALALASSIYGYAVGIINPETTFIKATVAFMGWLTPILFGYYLYVNWHRYPEYSKVIKKVCLWACLLIGLYGIYQYVAAPEWDRLWLIGSKMESSAGNPEPYGMRVWSTLNSPGPFGDMITTCLLILFSCTGALVVPAAGAGMISLLLCAVRVGWLGCFGGLVFFASSLKPKQLLRLLLVVLGLAICIIPLLTMEPFSTKILGRFLTFGDLENDDSAKIRQGIYKYFFEKGMFNFMGDGLGVNDTVDAGVLSLILDLGWLGSLPYMAALLLCGITLFKNLNKYPHDLFIKASSAVIVKSIAFFLAARVTAGVHGIIIWGFIGIGLAGQRYWNHQQVLQLQRFAEELNSDQAIISETP